MAEESNDEKTEAPSEKKGRMQEKGVRLLKVQR